MSLTFDMFQAICKTSLVTPRFLMISIGFGRKLSSGDDDFAACYSSFLTLKGQQKSEEKSQVGKGGDNSVGGK
jgi:hypothetical protein